MVVIVRVPPMGNPCRYWLEGRVWTPEPGRARTFQDSTEALQAFAQAVGINQQSTFCCITHESRSPILYWTLTNMVVVNGVL